MKDADRQALMQQMRDKMQALSPDARRAAFENGQQMFEKRELEHIKQILAMSPADRNKALDADIDRMEKMRHSGMRQTRMCAQAGGPGQNGPGGQRGRGPRGEYDRRSASRSIAQSARSEHAGKCALRETLICSWSMRGASSAGCRR